MSLVPAIDQCDVSVVMSTLNLMMHARSLFILKMLKHHGGTYIYTLNFMNISIIGLMLVWRILPIIIKQLETADATHMAMSHNQEDEDIGFMILISAHDIVSILRTVKSQHENISVMGQIFYGLMMAILRTPRSHYVVIKIKPMPSSSMKCLWWWWRRGTRVPRYAKWWNARIYLPKCAALILLARLHRRLHSLRSRR